MAGSAAGRGVAVGLRNMTVLPASASWAPWEAASGADACGTRGSAPQDTLRSCSPPKPDWRERSAPQDEAGSGRLPCCASAGAADAAGADAAGGAAEDAGDGAGAEAGDDAGVAAGFAGGAVDGNGSSCGSSSKKCGPVSSTEGCAGRTPGGGASGSPSLGAGRLVPGTQEEPFQYRTYPGMDGSG
ncbi:hypothetical protein RKD26_004122 [Streptomyces calvus]